MALRHLGILFVFGFMCSSAYADDLKIVGFSLSTTGTFTSGTPSDLAFYGSDFAGTSDGDGYLRLSDLGTFKLTKPGRSADVYHPQSDLFTLNLSFSGPLGIVQKTVFDATLKGTVNRNQGSVTIDFGPTRSFTFANSQGSGGFDLTFDDIVLSIGRNDSSASQFLTGRITNAWDPPAAVPEPQAVVLFGTVLVLIGFAFRRRRAVS